MPLTFTWLDYSEHERRKMLEVIELFGEKTTWDELGLGSVRDASADQRPMYVNWARDVNSQIATHKKVAGDEMIPPWLVDRVGRASRIELASYNHRDPQQLQEMRIVQVAKPEPWLDLLDFGDVA